MSLKKITHSVKWAMLLVNGGVNTGIGLVILLA